jgi:FkbM family methyltransferase
MDIVARSIGVVRRVSPRTGIRLGWKREVRHGARSKQLIDRMVSRGDVVIDIGAADGVYAERMLQLVGKHGFVYAIEPNSAQYPGLRRVGRRRRNFCLFPVAVSDRPGSANFFVPIHDGTTHKGLGSLDHHSAASTEMELRVRLELLDVLLADEARPISFIKIDVEGHERAVVAGAQGLIERSRPAMLIEIEQRHHKDPIDEVIDDIEVHGYSAWAVGSDGLLPRHEFDVDRDQTRHVDGFQNRMPAGYISDFLFLPAGSNLPS